MLKHASSAVVTAILAWGVPGPSTISAKEPPEPSSAALKEPASRKTPVEWSLDRKLSDETVSRSQKTVRASDIDPETFKPLFLVSDIKIENAPLLWKTDKNEVVIDRKYFSDLQIVDSRRLELDGDKVIGTYKGGRALEPAKVVELLIRSEIVLCRSHVRATVKLGQQRTDGNGYNADLSGSDEYYTSKRNVRYFRFGIRIDENGVIRLTKH